jgi:hypothetical protein
VVYFGTITTVWYILELLRRCGIFWNYYDGVVYFGTITTVWCILLFILLYVNHWKTARLSENVYNKNMYNV